jgi:hypothetical protein
MATKILKILLVITFALAVLPTAVSAQMPTDDSGAVSLPAFADADKDRSGGLDPDEASAIRGFDFNSVNANCDGQITRPEYEAARDQNREAEPVAPTSSSTSSKS